MVKRKVWYHATHQWILYFIFYLLNILSSGTLQAHVKIERHIDRICIRNIVHIRIFAIHR